VRRSGSALAQAGALMVEVSLALILASLAAYGAVREMVRTKAMEVAMTDADSLALYRQALQDYVDENYGALQFGTTITKNAVTLNAGTAAGQTLQPTVANLRDMGYLSAGFSDLTLVVDGASYRNVIERQPAGCVTNACNIVGLAYLSAPVRPRGSTNADSVALGHMLSRIGGLGGVSLETSPGTITGAGAAWSWVNPVAGTPAGVFGARFGFGSSVFSGYVRMNDTRNPNLQGSLTVANNITTNTLTVTGATTISGALNSTDDITARNITATQAMNATGQIRSQAAVGASDTVACLRAALESGGNILSRAANCVTRVQISNSGVSVNNTAGTPRINLDGTNGLLSVNTTLGVQNIGLDGATGRVSAQRLRPTTSATRDTACVDTDDLAADVDGSGTVLVCKSGVWRSPGLIVASVSTACTTLGMLARTSSDQALICRSTGAGNAWSLLNDRVTSAVVVDVWSSNGVANVPAPACGSFGTPDISVAALQGGSDYGVLPPRNRFEVRVTGVGPWTITPSMVDQSGNAYTNDSGGNPYSLGWTATTLCRYPG
jgi:hypothetical protein